MPRHPDVGAMSQHWLCTRLAEVMEKARVARLTRYQHILLRLGELIAYAESAGSWLGAPRCWLRASSMRKPTDVSMRQRWRRSAGSLPARRRMKVAEEGLRWMSQAPAAC
jgi:hypothetical protein